MTDAELWKAIREYNMRQKIQKRKLADLYALLPPPNQMLTVKEFVALLSDIREILGRPSR